MWNKHQIEDDLHSALTLQFGEEIGQVHFNKYISARNFLVENIYEEIKGKEPSLSDHGPKHIYNVLDNAKKLLSDDIFALTGMELYCLCLMILFHDVGNLEGRENHNKNITEIYNKVRNKESKFNHERRVIIKGAEAHCGKTVNGDGDTLATLDEIESIEGCRIRLREMAAILRFADELAEGPQRTSTYMVETNRYTKDSQIFHRYASMTNVFIDKGNNRVVLSYYIDIKATDLDDSTELIQLIHFVLERINKLDEERRYNKHYTPLLTHFKRTDVSINFDYEGMPIQGIEQIKIVLTDKYPVPGQAEPEGAVLQSTMCATLNIEAILKKIKDDEAVEKSV
jgi:hypothetical protein